MAIDISKLQKKLNNLSKKNDNQNFWNPEDNTTYSIRFVNTKDGDPFKEYWFHYEIGNGILCPKKMNKGVCPLCDFASKLYKEDTQESRNIAKRYLARQRFYSPIIIRGQEHEGIKVWGYSKNVYMDLINIILNPDYGDIADPVKGYDIVVSKNKIAGASFPAIRISPARKTSPVKIDVDTMPDFDNMFPMKSANEIEEIFNMNRLDALNAIAEAKKSMYNDRAYTKSAVDKAFADLFMSTDEIDAISNAIKKVNSEDSHQSNSDSDNGLDYLLGFGLLVAGLFYLIS